MLRTTMFLVLVGGVAHGGEWYYRWQGEGEYADQYQDTWIECSDNLFIPQIPQPVAPFVRTNEGIEGTLADGTRWLMKQGQSITLWRGDAMMHVGAAHSFIKLDGCRDGAWTWGVQRKGDTSGMTGYLAVSNLAIGDGDGFGSVLTDAADASYMFQWWGSPVADLTGDAMTDAADAGRLFELWTGDTGPHSVPEPAGWTMMALGGLALRTSRRKATIS